MTERARGPSATFDVVFICTGNQARSALAAALLTPLVAGLDVSVRSRGTQGGGDPALPFAIAAAESVGIDLGSHRSVPLAPGELSGSDLVIGFEPYHIAAGVVDGQAVRGRTFLLRELVDLVAAVPLAAANGTHARARENVEALSSWRPGGPPDEAFVTPDPAGRKMGVFHQLVHELDHAARIVAEAIFVGEGR